MENTIIIKDDGLAINSAEYDNFALVITDFGGTITSTMPDGQEQIQDIQPEIQLRAIKKPEGDSADDVHISTFYDLQAACNALQELFERVNSGIEMFDAGIGMFDVREHNPVL